MELSEDQIKKFQEIYFSNEGKRISDEKAAELFSSLVLMISAVYKPIPAEDFEKLRKLDSSMHN